MIFWITIISIIIIVSILLVSLKVTSMGYAYKHTIDPLPQNLDNENKQETKNNLDNQ